MNPVNEITNITESTGPSWVTPAYDRNGNMTTIPKPADPTGTFVGTYDAWNRLVELKVGDSIAATYAYDSLRRRIRKYVPGAPDLYQHFYFNDRWQLLETRAASTSPVPVTPQYQHIWCLRYVDAPVLCDDLTTDPHEVLYYLSDASFNQGRRTSSCLQQEFCSELIVPAG